MAINTPSNWDKELKKSKIEEFSDEKKDEISDLFWEDEYLILKDLKKNHVRIDFSENWSRRILLILPAIWNFKWFEFDCFIPNKDILKYDFEHKKWYVDDSYSIQEIWKLLKAINDYMKACWVETDWEMDYEKELKARKTRTVNSKAWNILNEITWLNEIFWLKDKNVGWINDDSRAFLSCLGHDCFVNYVDRRWDDEFSAHLLLKTPIK